MGFVKEYLQHLVTRWVDDWYRRLHDKRYLPPWSLRAMVGFPADFEVTGAEFLAYLKLLCGLESRHHVLDIGCGCGMMALQMRDYLSDEGHYLGMDIDPAAIEWCQAHIAAHDERFDFCHVDLGNLRYNPQGALSDASFRFDVPDANLDVILLKSVFTHMKPEGVRNYLHEIGRLLKPGGHCLATFFLLNPDQAALAERGKNALAFEHGAEQWRFVDPALPERAVAYREDDVLEMLQRSGLTLAAAPYYGTWTGRLNGLSFQDILLLTGE